VYNSRNDNNIKFQKLCWSCFFLFLRRQHTIKVAPLCIRCDVTSFRGTFNSDSQYIIQFIIYIYTHYVWLLDWMFLFCFSRTVMSSFSLPKTQSVQLRLYNWHSPRAMIFNSLRNAYNVFVNWTNRFTNGHNNIFWCQKYWKIPALVISDFSLSTTIEPFSTESKNLFKKHTTIAYFLSHQSLTRTRRN